MGLLAVNIWAMEGERGPDEDDEERRGVILKENGSGCVESRGEGLGEG